MSIIKLKNVNKYYNKKRKNEIHVLNDINLELPDKGIVAIFGQSGCGKTTLLNAIGGLDKIQSGSIEIDGKDINKNTDIIRNEYIGYIFQNYNLNVNETVFENVADAIRLCGITDEKVIHERVIKALENVDLKNYINRYPNTLSGGQMQRVAIARVLVKNPKIILADEPTGNLDESNTVLVMDILKEIAKNHLVLLVTHEKDLVDYYCSKIISISDGKIIDILDNEITTGYIEKNKNNIYLGDLEQYGEESGHSKINYYGSFENKIELKIVNYNGKIYLKCETPDIKIIDNQTEIKLVDTSFKKEAQIKTSNYNIDMTGLEPIQGKKFGSLFNFKQSLKLSLRDNFSKRGKKARGIFTFSLIFLSFILVYFVANFGVSLKSYIDTKNNVSKDSIMIPLNLMDDFKPVTSSIGDNGIEFENIINSPYYYTRPISFSTGRFVTASNIKLSSEGIFIGIDQVKNVKLLAGEKEIKHQSDVIISKKIADELIESSVYSYIKNYSDLIDLISTEVIYDEKYIRICGVVDIDEPYILCDPVVSTYITLNNVMYTSKITSASLAGVNFDIPKDSILFYSTYSFRANAGDVIEIMGNKYTVFKSVTYYEGLYQYEDYVENVRGVSLIGLDEYYSKNMAIDSTVPSSKYIVDWYNYYFSYMDEFAINIIRTKPSRTIPYELWRIAQGNALLEKISYIQNYAFQQTFDLNRIYLSCLYYNENHEYIGNDEYYEYLSEYGYYNKFSMDYIKDKEDNYQEYYDFCYRGPYEKDVYNIVLNDEDFCNLRHSIGRSHYKIEMDSFDTYTLDGETYSYKYLLVHCSDYNKAYKYLYSIYGDKILTPKQILNEQLIDNMVQILIGTIKIIVILLLMCISIYFIMRSNFMRKVKEIGIFRCIGVSKKNILFRFIIESVVVATLSVFIGYLVGVIFIYSLSNAQLFSELFVLPLWLALVILVILYGVSILFGISPVLKLLKKTPSEIIAKYDI